ncbi:MAG: hypothetical protein ACLSIL_14675 [Enterococcus casseliflavus]
MTSKHKNTIFLSILEAFDIWEKPKPRYDKKGNKLKPKMKEIADQQFSFDYDAPNIYAAFTKHTELICLISEEK